VGSSAAAGQRARQLSSKGLGGEETSSVTLEDLGNVGEIVAAVGVIISLVYLAVQIRQNTRAVRASLYQSTIQQARDFDRTVVSDPELGRLWVRGRSSPDDLDEEEWRRFRRLLSMFYRNFENLHFQYQNGLVDDRLYASWLAMMVRVSRQPGARRWWEAHGAELTEDCRRLVERELAA
jgi:hypothetical protein